jgi:hypothetical protein
MPSAPEKNAVYQARHFVRAFLSQYARPSVCVDLHDSMDPSDPWAELVNAVHTELTGEPIAVVGA